MNSTPSTRASVQSRTSTAGFSLVELLVALGLTGLVLGLLASGFATATKTNMDMNLVIEADQGVRAILSTITQEVRQTGSCLPTNGRFTAMTGTNSGTSDSLTIRMGRVDPASLACIATTLSSSAAAGSTFVPVVDTSKFEDDDWVYVTRSGGEGDTYTVTSKTSTKLYLDPPLQYASNSGSGVYAIEERTYYVESGSGNPYLAMLIDDDETVIPLVDGVSKFDVRYGLEPCPPCATKDLPLNESEWFRVRRIDLAVEVRAPRPNSSGEYVTRSGETQIRPRNLF